MNSVAKRPWVTRTIPIIIDLPLVVEIFSSRFVDREVGGVAVADADDAVVGGKPAGEPLGDEYRAVTAAGAADRDRDVALAFALEGRQQRLQERSERCEERRIGGVALDEAADLRIAAGERAQGRIIVRILQEPHVENQVGF